MGITGAGQFHSTSSFGCVSCVLNPLAEECGCHTAALAGTVTAFAPGPLYVFALRSVNAKIAAPKRCEPIRAEAGSRGHDFRASSEIFPLDPQARDTLDTPWEAGSTVLSHLSHSQYSVVRNCVCGGHVEQKHCKATGPPEQRHPKFSASSEAVASACWGASSLGCRSMGQENLQVILAAERHQSDTLSDTQTCLSKAPAPILCSSNNSRMPRNNREKKGIWFAGFLKKLVPEPVPSSPNQAFPRPV